MSTDQAVAYPGRWARWESPWFKNCEQFGCVHEIEQAGECDGANFHPSGTVMATANLDRTISLWSVDSWTLLATLRGHPGEVWAVAFSPDGALLASGSMDKSVRLWDWRSGQCLNTLQGHTSYVRAVNFSPDGALLASCGYHSTIRLWDVSHPGDSATCVATIPGPGGAAQLCVTFSPDGALLASAGVDGRIHLWEVSSAVEGKAPLCVLEDQTGRVYSLSFRNDGRLLASSSEDGTIRMWDVSDVKRGVACVQILHVERPYARMNIAGVTGLTQAQITSLQALGSIEES